VISIGGILGVDAQTTINLVGGAILAILGWFARTLWDAVKELQTDLHQLEVDLPTTYVTKDDFKEVMARIEDMFERIYDKLDEKQDKSK
jgi:hypothetical protein